LQDISLIFGSDRGRFYEFNKRAVDNFSQNGPLIKTIMTRCIHCTRCVRFANEVSEFSLGTLDRGSNMEIGTYYDISLLDELSGNIIDLCPVGALTSMPYAFKLRPWETAYYTNIDFLDSLASSIRLHIYNNKIVRVLPLLDENLNEEWITNKARFSYDGFNMNRNYYPKIKILKKFIVFSWDFVINYLFFKLNSYINLNKSINCCIGNYLDFATALSIKGFFLSLGLQNIIYNDKLCWIFSFNFFFFLNNTLYDLENDNFYLFIACDLRLEAPVLNVRIRKNFNKNKNNELFLFSYGLGLKHSTYPIKNIGNTVLKLFEFFMGKSRHFCAFFFKDYMTVKFIKVKLFFFYNKPSFFLGNSILYRNDSKNFLNLFILLYKKMFNWKSFNLINSFLGFFSFGNILYNNILHFNKITDLIYNISSDYIYNVNFKDKFIISHAFFINNDVFNVSDLILPITAPYEMENVFINLEGKTKLMKQNIKSFFSVYTDWEILALLNIYNKKNVIVKLIKFSMFLLILKLFKSIINYICNYFISMNYFYIEIIFFGGLNINPFIELQNLNFFFKLKFLNTFLSRYINNYYNTDSFIRNSKIMSFCSLKKNIVFKI